MLGCIYQLWDWLEAPPLFNAATMDAKKLQQLQQAQHLQKKIPLAYQTNIADYRTSTHSPVFQQQQHGNYHLGHVTATHQQKYQQSPTTTASSGPLTPIDIQPHTSKLLLKHQLQSSGSGGSSAHSSPYHQASTSSGYPTSSTGGTGGTDQLYQSPTERTYLAAAGRSSSAHNQATNLQLQYQQLQQAKLQAQLATQNEAAQNQQRQFALRQMINPPVPQAHYHLSQSSSVMSTLTQKHQQQQQQQPNQTHQQQQQQQRAPPSSLNLTNQFQPAAGPLKVTQQNTHKSAQHYHQQQQQQEQIYGQHQHQQLQMQLHHQQQLQQHHHAIQQRSKSDLQTPQSSDQSPIYIQQNHPGHVVNQAVQTQISTVAKTSSNPPQMTKTPSSEESSSASAKSPSHAPLDRKKSGGGSTTNSQALKSPITKRPPNSPVTISGWLYKQGSDGLKVWRKRWFVLAEYCLYYYKGPEEEKVLGSILLPSYKVSACLQEDKIYRKYAFKCEHQNMRTYWLAAENAESMVQWVRSLSAATMMQAPSSAGESSEQPSGSSSLNHSGENSDSGIHTLQSQQSKMSGQGQVTPASDNGGVTTSSSSGAGGTGQPLYANAPPKPRRITDGGYSSPSPEQSIDNEGIRQHQILQQQQQTSRRSGVMSPTLQQMQQYQQQQQQQQSRSQHHAIYDTRTGNVSSAMRLPQQQQSSYPIDSLESQYQQQLTLSSDEYPQSPLAQYMDAQMEQQIMQLQQQRAAVDDIYGERELYMQRLIQQRYPPHMSAYVSAAERRTPDAYGRSKNRVFSDYEDIYNLAAGAGNTSAQEALMQEAASYRRPLSPPSYESNKHVPSSMAARYTPNNSESSPGHSAAGSNMNLRSRPLTAIVRPHSADFLEYEARAEAAADAATKISSASMVKPDRVRAPRPKSSLDINRTPDSYYYSEENYAEKMRKSALYLQNPQAQPQQAVTYRTTSGPADLVSPVVSGMNTIGYENPYEKTYKRNELLQDALGNQAGHTSIPRMSRSQTMGNGSQIRSSSSHPHHSQSPPSQQQQEQLQISQSPAYQQKQTSQSSLLSSGLTTQQIIQQNEQFLRSASARLPKRSSTFDDELSSPTTTSNTTTTVTSPPTGTTSPPTAVAGSGGPTQTAPTSHLDGERKREESMKRLLEWKQRMLQSPLTRKGAQHSMLTSTQNGQTAVGTSNISAMSKLGSNPNILLASTAVASGAHYPNSVTTGQGGISSTTYVAAGIQRSRSETHANTGPTAGYNSYSSDDEAGKIIKTSAGRSSLRAATSDYGQNTSTSLSTNTTSSTVTTSVITKISTNTTQKPQVLTTSTPMTSGGHATNNLSNENATIKRLKKTFAINDLQQQKQQKQLPQDTSEYPMTSFLTGSTDSTLTATSPQASKALKPILKTKIINVKPVPAATPLPSPSIFHSELEVSLGSSLSKTPKAIAKSLHENTVNESSSPQISSYVPVYNTVTVVPTKCQTLSNNSENFEKDEDESLGNAGIYESDSNVSVNESKITESFKAEEYLETSKTDTEAIQYDEDTPILMGLKRFKEKEEKRQKLQLNLEEAQTNDEDATTPTQDTIGTQREDSQQELDLQQAEDDEDTTCEYTDDDLDEALAEQADVEEDTTVDTSIVELDLADDKEISKIYENEPISPHENQQNFDESHYLPMSAKKIESDQSGNVRSTLTLVSMLDSNEEEENHYVEMTKQLQEEDSKNNYEIMCINNSPNSQSIGASCKSKQLKIMNEPLYMELQGIKTVEKLPKAKGDIPLQLGKTSTLKKSKKASDTLKKKLKKTQQERIQQKRKDLPDILKPPQNSLVINSDSSDADDESSKNMDSKKMRSRTRFSLSDTFRPASYYLGASTPLNNCIESSDSEIVSPPPIPNSPPPIDDLKTEEIFSAENYDTVKRRDSSSCSKFNISYEQLPKMHASNSSLDFPKNEAALKSSRLSLPDQFGKVKTLKVSPHLLMLKQHERTLSDSNYSFQTDNSSNNSSDFDLYNKLKKNSPSYIATPTRYQSNSSLSLSQQKTSLPGTGNSSETDTVELRHRQASDSELERQRSRRPLSEESISEIESLSEKFEDALETADLDTYLSDLQNNDLYLYQNTKFEPSARALTSVIDAVAGSETGVLTNLIKPPKIFRNQDDGHCYGNIHFLSSTDSLQKIEGPNDQFDILGATSMTPTRYATPLHSRNNSNISEQSAPYYYSELSSSRELLSTPTTLNNQRDIHAQGFNIDHIHNPIERAHNINVEILTDKDQAIDSKNLYKMKTNIEKLSYSSGKNLKTGEPFHPNSFNPSPSRTAQTYHIEQIQNPALKMSNYKINLSHSQTLNSIHGTNTNSQTTSLPTISSTNTVPSTSSPPSASSNSRTGYMVCGKVDVNAKNVNLQMGNMALVAQNTLAVANISNTNDAQKPANNSDKSTVLGGPGELLWEEDSLWRESLRRVSQRHARSLDDLDHITISPARITPAHRSQIAAAELNRKPRLSRDVTYVNDNVSQHLRSSFKLRHTGPHNLNTYDQVCEDQTINQADQSTTNDHDVYVQLTENVLSPHDLHTDLYEVLREDTSSNISSNKSTEIDRETIRQWDSMSSGLMKNSVLPTNLDQSPTAGSSISVRNVRNLPKGNLTVKPDPSDPLLQQQRQLQQQKYNYDQMQKLENSYYGTAHDMKYAKTTLLTDRNTNVVGNTAINEALVARDSTYATSTPLHRSSNNDGGQDYYGTNAYIYDMLNGYQQQQHLQQLQQQQQLLSHPIRRVGSRAEIDILERETSSQIRNLDVSAGDLLSRTHEELVLLLIQLRRQNSNTARAIEQCCSDIHDVQNRLRTAEGLTRAESIQRLDYLKQHLLDLERQYEKSKPLVNLVDNMVKLGSLYRNDANGKTQRPEAVTLDRLEFNQRIQEKRLLQEEQKQWDRLNPDHSELQSKVRQLYHLDQLLQEESGTLQNLQRDKEDLERALGGLKARIQDTSGPPLALEAAKKQQIMLEHELSTVHQLLAENSKKLEQTVAGNARLEQELLVLRQKLQASRGSQSTLQISDTYTSNTTAMLESELKRVQTLVGDMQRQRQELSSAVKQLTENSNRLYQEIGKKEHGSLRNGESNSNNGSIKKRINSGCWIETDLDSMVCVNRTLTDSTMNLSTPLYVDTSSNNSSGNFLKCSLTSSNLSDYNTGDCITIDSHRRMGSASYRYNDSSDNLETSGVDSDGFLETNPFANLTQQEKQEIKTVRIVKRESERRHRDRSERSGLSNSIQNLDQVAEEEQYSLVNNSNGMGMGGNYIAKEYQANEKSKSLPRTSYTETSKSSSRHHYRHKHGSSHHNSGSISVSSAIPIYNDYYGHNGGSSVYDNNSNYSSHHSQQQHKSQHSHQHLLTNGHGNSQQREHLNPLANAYFAKQIQQQKQQNIHNHQNSSSSHSRHSSQISLRQKTGSVQSLNKSLSDLTPSFQSEAARQIINEMSAGSASEDTEKVQEKVPSQHKHRRAVPKEKRRHYTAPNNVVPVKAIENGQTENDMNKNNTNWRARDDLDMEVALRPRINAPDVVRSALRHGEKISENTIDNLLLAPNKIVIPERYIPETTPELSPEEKKRRQEKVESIKKMLSEAPISAANETTATLPPSKINEEKKQREHLLQLNQILAQQVMQISKIVAEKAMSRVGNGTEHNDDYRDDDDDDDDDNSPNGGDQSESPSQPLPIYQQRNNYYS